MFITFLSRSSSVKFSASQSGKRTPYSALSSSISRAAIFLNSLLIDSPDSSCWLSTRTVIGRCSQAPLPSSFRKNGNCPAWTIVPAPICYSQPAIMSCRCQALSSPTSAEQQAVSGRILQLRVGGWVAARANHHRFPESRGARAQTMYSRFAIVTERRGDTTVQRFRARPRVCTGRRRLRQPPLRALRPVWTPISSAPVAVGSAASPKSVGLLVS